MTTYKKLISPSLLKGLICGVFTVAAVAVAQAQSAKVDPSGTWTWSNPGRNGNPGRTNTLTLKYSGSALTGNLTLPTRGGGTTNVNISDGKVTGDQISFNIVREMNDNSVTNEFAGAISGDSIKGDISTERDGEKRSRKWEAKRAAMAAAPDAK
jgi:hypothetical protein